MASAQPIRDPYYAPLTGKEAESAIKGQIAEYPKVLRSDKDIPVVQQTYGLASMLLFKEPKKTEGGKPCYGFLKLRGNWSDKNQCSAAAAGIVRTQDSTNKIRLMEVGAWYPITDDDGPAEKIDVRTEMPADEEKLKREAIKQKEEEASRIIKEIKDRQEEIKNSPDLNDDKESLDHYVMKRVTWMRLRENIEQFRKKVDDLEGKWRATRKILEEMDEEHPDYDERWLDRYNEERKKTKIPDYIPSQEETDLYEKNVQ